MGDAWDAVVQFGVPGLFLLGMAIGATILGVFAPETCYRDFDLGPGQQISCNRTRDDSIYITGEATTRDGSSALRTYVFDKEPNRTTIDEKFTFTFNNDNYIKMRVPMVPGSVYRWRLDADQKCRLIFSSKNGPTVLEMKDISHTSGVYNATEDEPYAYFYISASGRITGSFTVVVSWLAWDVNSVEPVITCSDYPCEWSFNDSDYWIVTVNHDRKNSYYAEIIRTPNLAIWVTLGVVIIFLTIVGDIFLIVFARRHYKKLKEKEEKEKEEKEKEKEQK